MPVYLLLTLHRPIRTRILGSLTLLKSRADAVDPSYRLPAEKLRTSKLKQSRPSGIISPNVVLPCSPVPPDTAFMYIFKFAGFRYSTRVHAFLFRSFAPVLQLSALRGCFTCFQELPASHEHGLELTNYYILSKSLPGRTRSLLSHYFRSKCPLTHILYLLNKGYVNFGNLPTLKDIVDTIAKKIAEQL